MIILPDAERIRLWGASYRFWTDQLPDLEIGWERDLWQALGFPVITSICDGILRERAEFDFSIPSEATIPGLEALWKRADQPRAIARVLEQATPLVDALRLDYWLGTERQAA
jgi:hypothetical protein